MKKLIQIFFLQFIFFNSIVSQEVYVEIKSEFTASKVKFDWEDNLSNQSGNDEIGYNFSIGLSGKIYKNFYLKSTLGSSDFKNSINVDWDSENANHQIIGWVSTKQNYLEILPEIRFLKNQWLFVNLGFGLNQIRNSELTSGFYWRRAPYSFGNLGDEFPNFSGRYEYFVMNVGANLQYKNLGLILEFGIRNSGFTERKTEIPGIGVNQKSIKIGISYKLNGK